MKATVLAAAETITDPLQNLTLVLLRTDVHK